MREKGFAILIMLVLFVTSAGIPDAQAKSIHIKATTLRLPAGTELSSNWSGYAVTSANNNVRYNNISGKWRVPKASASKQAAAAQWIGLGGFASSDLLQMGTIESVYKHHQITELFWEKLPDMAHNMTKFAPGSVVSATISKQSTDGHWCLKFLVTKPNGKKFTRSVQIAVASNYETNMERSAEWINEDPSNSKNKLYPLASTGTISFSNLSLNGSPMRTIGNIVHPLAVTNASKRLLLVPSVTKGGTSFSIRNTSHQYQKTKVKKVRHRFRISHHNLKK